MVLLQLGDHPWKLAAAGFWGQEQQAPAGSGMSSPKLCPSGLCFMPHRSSGPGVAKSLFCLSPAASVGSSRQNFH